MSTRVLIRHPKSGREYSILPADFTNPRVSPDRKTYADQGYEIVSYVDGTPYEGPTTLKEIEQGRGERQAARADKPAERATEKGKGA